MIEFTPAEKVMWDELRNVRIVVETQTELIALLLRRLERLEAGSVLIQAATSQQTPEVNLAEKQRYQRRLAAENDSEWGNISEALDTRFQVPVPWEGSSTPKPLPQSGELL